MDIIAKLEAATEPSRELDIGIGQAVDTSDTFKVSDTGECLAFDDGHASEYGISGWFPLGCDVPQFTKSIDDALTLVPEGYRWHVGNAWKDRHGSCPAMASVCIAGDYGTRPATGATPAIALCIAALKARTQTIR